jgi:toxin ParE1/3/4
MAYKVIVSTRAQKEVENAIDYYALYSIDAPVNFIAVLKKGLCHIGNKPIL